MKIDLPPEPSLGTHFFQDLLEAQIYPLAIYLDDPQNTFSREFFYNTPNHAADFTHLSDVICPAVRLICVADYRPECHLRVVMSDERSEAVAYLEGDAGVGEEAASFQLFKYYDLQLKYSVGHS